MKEKIFEELKGGKMEKLSRKIKAISIKQKAEGKIGFLTEEDENWYNVLADEQALDEVLKIIQKGNVVEFELELGIPKNFVLKEVQESHEKPKEITKETNRNHLEIDKKFIVNIQGSEFITYNGLLAYAEIKGGIKEKLILELKESNDWKSARATVQIVMKDGRIFQDVGTCTPENSKSVKTYPQELAVTRAYARALRTGLNVDYCSKEETEH
jgi:ribosomal protein S25